MGILNCTPDSFSDGGLLPTVDAVVQRARQLVAEGADVLDFGGESTRPGAAPVSAEDEMFRILPAIEAVRHAMPDVPISVDTYKAQVAAAAIHAGADIVNDVWGLTHGLSAEDRRELVVRLARGQKIDQTTAMAETVSRLGCPVILMHNRPDRAYRDFWTDVLLDLRLSVAMAEAAGVAATQIWLDPGFGFAKDPAQNLEVLRDLSRIVNLGFPVLVGTSRKSTLGRVLGSEVDDRLDGTGATIVWAIQQGCAMVRVHDVAPLRRYVRMADAIRAGLSFSQ
ncbi:MAG TPA: dihydropteroate synthase family protein [Lacunisphaera sp.]|jgi:dihydropteroate synthase|nr:dihydropteroate synthase family protein [Lacunisphaera sp.]